MSRRVWTSGLVTSLAQTLTHAANALGDIRVRHRDLPELDAIFECLTAVNEHEIPLLQERIDTPKPKIGKKDVQ